MPSVNRSSSTPADLSAAEAREASGIARSAGADGKITTTEIKEAERKVAAKYGAEKARAILVSALGQDPEKIDFKAVDYLQGKIGAMDGHVDRFQQVLAGHLKGAKLLDANFDGKLDKKDLVFTKDSAGKVSVKTIGQALCDRVRIGAAMVDAAHAMGAAKHEFDGKLTANPQVWKVSGNPMGTMKPKAGVKPSDAIGDVFANPDKYSFECATALVVLRYKAILDLVGPKDFDRICGDLKIGPWVQEDHADKAWKVRGKGEDGKTAATDKDKADLKPGDYTYFKNWSVSLPGYNAGWQGENVIFLGDGMYYGHPFGIVSAEEIVDSLNEWRRTGRNIKSASLLDLRASVDPSILKEDKTPG